MELNHRSSLCYADKRWLKRLRLSVGLQVWGIPLWVLVALTIHWMAGMSGSAASWQIFSAWCLWYASCIYVLIATLLLTTVEPHPSIKESALSIRRLLRYCATVMGVGATVFALNAFNPPSRTRLGSPWAGVGVEVATACLWLLIGLHLSRLADRMDCPGLKKRTVVITASLVTLALAAGLFEPVADAAEWDRFEFTGVFTILLGIIRIAGIVYLTQFVLLLFEYKRQFGQACETAYNAHGSTTA